MMTGKHHIPLLFAGVALVGALVGPAAGAQTAAVPAQFAPPVVPAAPPAKPAPAPAATGAPILESETSDIAVLPAAGPHRLFVASRSGGIAIMNGDTAKREGTVNAAPASGFAVAPDNSRFYVSESIWSRINRGTRQDLLSVYDGTSLKLLTEITLPGRLIASGRIPYFNLSASGHRGYVLNMQPAASVVVVDLKANKVVSEIETPGCGLIFPFRDAGFAALCADGSLANVTVDGRGKGSITHTPVFFNAEQDPVFEESLVDRGTGKALFITYTGMVHPATLGATTTLDAPWSLQQAAGLGTATTAPQHKTWRPGGRHPFAIHAASGRLFVLMHNGKHWTQKEAGSEVWVFDTTTRALLRRFELPTDGTVVAVSQDADPQLYVVSHEGWFWVMNPETGRIERNLKDLGRTGLITVTGY
jgi:methylamine dehydrogenase heavy chain